MEEKAPKPKQPTNQIDIDFEKLAKIALENENKEIKKKYGIPDDAMIFKDPEGVWKFYGTYQPVAEWYKDKEEMDDLYKDNDNSSLYKH